MCIPIRGLGHALIWSNLLQNPCNNSQSAKRKIDFHCPQPFQSPQRKTFLTWHLRVNLNKWMKMKLVKKNQVKKKRCLRKVFKWLWWRIKQFSMFLLGEVEQQNIRNSKSKNCFHSSFNYLFKKSLIDKLMGIKTTPHLKIVWR